MEDAFGAAYHGWGCSLHGLDADPTDLPVESWSGTADRSDHALAARCHGATLDIGCGPGRMAEVLAARGQVVLGIDVVPEAVFRTRDRGVPALLRDVFERLPGEGRWQTALLADGNLGIGGDPVSLLRRIGDVIAPEGRVVADLARPGTGLRVGSVRLESAGVTSEPFPWAVVGTDAVEGLAASAGYGVRSTERYDERWFAVLERVA